MSRSALLVLLVLGLALPARAEVPQCSFVRGGPTLEKVAFGSEVRDRELLGQGESFRVGQRVYCWSLITGGKPGELVRHVWFHEGEEVQSFELPVEMIYWRAWTYRTLASGMTGAWRVEIRDAQGKVLGSQAFTCTD